MKKVEIFFTNLHELCLFKRSSEAKGCQIDFERKLLRGFFPEAEINVAKNVFGAMVTEMLTA